MIVQLQDGDFPAVGSSETNAGDLAASTYLCDEASLAAFLRVAQTLVVYTFGDVTRLASVWTHAAQVGCALVHFVAGEGAFGAGAAISRMAWSRAGLRAKGASRHVCGLLGSNRASIGSHIEAGFFPRAKFSMITLPPIPMGTRTEDRSPPRVFSTPMLGYYAHEGAQEHLNFLLDAIKLTGSQHLFRLLIAQQGVRPAAQVRAPANVSFLRVDKVGDFVTSIDVLVVLRSDNCAIEAALMALCSNKIVMAPDGGSISEALQYGRHGILFGAGSAYELAMAIDNVSQSWERPPFDFTGADAAIRCTSPDEVAQVFARASRKLVEQATAEPAKLMVQ
jgi:hypothetical protein